MRGVEIPSNKTVFKHYAVIFRVNNSKVFYFVSNAELITGDDLIM